MSDLTFLSPPRPVVLERYRWSGDILTLEDLDGFAKDLSQRPEISRSKFVNAMVVSIIVHFLGKQWYHDHAYLESPEKSYLKPQFDENERAPKYSILTLNLAEMLFNLQHVEGFTTCLEHMNLDQLESALAELQVGMLLYQDKVPFRYIDASTVEGKSYDIEIRPSPGLTANVEIKCKNETTACTVETVKNTLKDGLKQLPKSQPGLLFVKVPQQWTGLVDGDVRVRVEAINAAREFLRNTTRVVRVIFYLFHLQTTPEGIGVSHAVREVGNPRNPAGSPWSEMFFKFDNDGAHWVDMPKLLARWRDALPPLAV